MSTVTSTVDTCQNAAIFVVCETVAESNVKIEMNNRPAFRKVKVKNNWGFLILLTYSFQDQE